MSDLFRAHIVKSHVLVQPFVYIFRACLDGTDVEDETVSTSQGNTGLGDVKVRV
jgi:hypothetical protein